MADRYKVWQSGRRDFRNDGNSTEMDFECMSKDSYLKNIKISADEHGYPTEIGLECTNQVDNQDEPWKFRDRTGTQSTDLNCPDMNTSPISTYSWHGDWSHIGGLRTCGKGFKDVGVKLDYKTECPQGYRISGLHGQRNSGNGDWHNIGLNCRRDKTLKIPKDAVYKLPIGYPWDETRDNGGDSREVSFDCGPDSYITEMIATERAPNSWISSLKLKCSNGRGKTWNTTEPKQNETVFNRPDLATSAFAFTAGDHNLIYSVDVEGESVGGGGISNFTYEQKCPDGYRMSGMRALHESDDAQAFRGMGLICRPIPEVPKEESELPTPDPDAPAPPSLEDLMGLKPKGGDEGDVDYTYYYMGGFIYYCCCILCCFLILIMGIMFSQRIR